MKTGDKQEIIDVFYDWSVLSVKIPSIYIFT